MAEKPNKSEKNLERWIKIFTAVNGALALGTAVLKEEVVPDWYKHSTLLFIFLCLAGIFWWSSKLFQKEDKTKEQRKETDHQITYDTIKQEWIDFAKAKNRGDLVRRIENGGEPLQVVDLMCTQNDTGFLRKLVEHYQKLHDTNAVKFLKQKIDELKEGDSQQLKESITQEWIMFAKTKGRDDLVKKIERGDEPLQFMDVICTQKNDIIFLEKLLGYHQRLQDYGAVNFIEEKLNELTSLGD